jgi:hypothetical protein
VLAKALNTNNNNSEKYDIIVSNIDFEEEEKRKAAHEIESIKK